MKRNLKFWLRTPVALALIPFAFLYDIVGTACLTVWSRGLRHLPREVWKALCGNSTAVVDMAIFTLTGRNRRKERQDKEWEEIRRSYFP